MILRNDNTAELSDLADAEQQLDQAIESGATVVTATRRLSREMVNRYDQRQQEQNKTAWQSADILPWDAWLKRTWTNHKTRIENPPLVLSDQQLLLNWQNIIAADIAQNESDSEPLWHIRSSATAGIQALKLLREWCIDPQAIAESPHRDHRCFSRWYNQFDQLCNSHHWIDQFQIPHLLSELTIDTSQVLLAGFDRLLPQQTALVERMQQQGIQVSHAPRQNRACESINCFQFQSEKEHWLGAAGWAREHLEKDPAAKLAIVVSNPGKSRELIDQCLKQILCPEHIRSPETNFALPFHISLGKPLSSYPPVRQAMFVLNALCRRKQSPEDLCRLVRSSYIGGAKSERIARAQLEQWIRQTQPQDSSYQAVLKFLNERLDQHDDQSLSLLHILLSNAHKFLIEISDQDLFANHATTFAEILSLLGWPGEQSPDTADYQAIEAFRIQLRGIGELDLSQSKVRLGEALSVFQHRLDQQVFQIEGNDAPIQVMGVLETSGMSFDHIWFGSLTAADWPNGTRPNPFIPIGLQRLAGVEQASVEENLAYASLQQNRIEKSCETLNLGFHRMDGDIALESSPLLAQFKNNIQVINETPLPVANVINQTRPTLVTNADNVGLAVEDASAIRGGTSLIQMQALCPRGAYASYRLGAKRLEQNEPGLDAAERGSLVHNALERMWESLQTSEHLQKIDEQSLHSLMQDCAHSASNRYRLQSSCGDRFFERLKSWLVVTLEEWFSLEKKRSAPFRVLSVEEKTQLVLSELPLDFKIDRIDQLASGELILIDYKTGSQNSINAWREERISAPQLPLYALSQHSHGHSIHAIVFAQVRLGDCAYIGLAKESGFALPEAKQIRVKGIEEVREFNEQFGSWDQCFTYWRYAMENLAEEFMFGDARVAPGNESVCVNCPTPAICRSGNRVDEQIE